MFGAHEFASGIWGVPPKQYYAVADVWPLNPKGELMIGVKIEDNEGLPHTEKIVRVPGVIFAEWGPRDTSYSNGFLDVAFDYGRKPGVVEPPPLKAAADRVIAASKAAKVFILSRSRLRASRRSAMPSAPISSSTRAPTSSSRPARTGTARR